MSRWVRRRHQEVGQGLVLTHVRHEATPKELVSHLCKYLDDGALQVLRAEGSNGTELRHLGWVMPVGNFVLSTLYTSPRRRLSRSSRCSRLLAGLKGGSPMVIIGGMRMCCAAGSLATLFKTEYTDSALRLVSISR